MSHDHFIEHSPQHRCCCPVAMRGARQHPLCAGAYCRLGPLEPSLCFSVFAWLLLCRPSSFCVCM